MGRREKHERKQIWQEPGQVELRRHRMEPQLLLEISQTSLALDFLLHTLPGLALSLDQALNILKSPGSPEYRGSPPVASRPRPLRSQLSVPWLEEGVGAMLTGSYWSDPNPPRECPA